MDESTETYYQSLKGSPAVEYLESRGLSGASAQRFKIGYVSDPLVGHEKFAGRLAIPYLTRAGVTSIKFRALDNETRPKYLTGNKGQRLFNPEALFDSRPYVCVCEGELDAIAATQAGLPAVGIAGVDNWLPYFRRVFDGYEEVFILGDADDKGQGEAFATAFGNLIPNSKTVLMPDGHDVNSFIVEAGESALLDKIGVLE